MKIKKWIVTYEVDRDWITETVILDNDGNGYEEKDAMELSREILKQNVSNVSVSEKDGE